MTFSKNAGKTPLVKISERIFAKFEGHNPSGSLKDRMATFNTALPGQAPDTRREQALKPPV